MDFVQGAGSEKELSFRRDLIRVAQHTVGLGSITELDDLYVAIQIQGHKVGEPLNNLTHLDGSKVTNTELTILTGALFLPFSSKLITKLGPDFMRGAGNLGDSILNFTFDSNQIQKKFKHASDFGINGPWNIENGNRFKNALNNHIRSSETIEKGTYQYVKNSKVYYSSVTNNVVIMDNSNNFISGFKLSPGTKQFENFIKNGVLR